MAEEIKNFTVTPDNFHGVCNTLLFYSEMAFDTETTGLHPYHGDTMLGFSFATANFAAWFDLRDLDHDQCRAFLDTVFGNAMNHIFIHNAKFDMHFLITFGVNDFKASISCTMVLARLKNNVEDSLSLGSLAGLVGAKKHDTVMKEIRSNKLYKKDVFGDKAPDFGLVNKEVLAKYAMQDASVTYKLGVYFTDFLYELSRSVKEENIGKNLTRLMEIERETTKTLFAMEKFGVLVDHESINKSVDEETRAISQFMDDFKREHKSAFVDSGKFLTSLFTGTCDEKEFKKTELGNNSFTDDVLSGFGSDIAKNILSYRHHKKRLSTYFGNYTKLADSGGYIHANFNQAGTRTSRLSCSAPNLQNVSNNETEGSRDSSIRSCFIPPVGFIWTSLDYKFMEVVQLVDMAGEKVLAESILAGEDPHQATADMMGVSRKKAKTINFACIAVGQKVLTHRGLVPIEQVTLEDTLWDGVEFVSHAGVVYMGEKEVITFGGLTATSDHKVYTKEGRKVCFGEIAHKIRWRSAMVTESGGNPIRVPDDYTIGIQEEPKAHPHCEHETLHTKRTGAKHQKKKVYDILNSGPRNRFTVSGILVSNCLYGMGVDKLASMLAVDVPTAIDLRTLYFDRLPAIKKFSQEVTRKAKNKGYLHNIYGRVYWFKNGEFPHKGLNYLIQGSCADIVRESMVRAHKYLQDSKLSAKLVLSIHDELCFYVPDNEIHIVKDLANIMETTYTPNLVGHRVDISTSSKSWGDCS